MAPQTFKNIIVVGASGTIGAPITAALLSHGTFNLSALSRPTSTATFPPGVAIKRAELSSHADLVAAFQGQDVVICTLNDDTAPLQPGIIEAAYEAGVKRFIPNEWANHDMVVPGTPMEDVLAGKKGTVKLLEEKANEAEMDGRVFHWTGVNNGLFFDWALQVGFADITLPPTRTAKIWNDGNHPTTCTTLATVAKAVIAILTTSEEQTRDRLVNIQSFVATSNEIVQALEKATGEKWVVEKTTTEEELRIAGEALEKGDFLMAFYGWIKSCIFTSELAVLQEVQNEALGLEEEKLDVVVGKVVRGEKV